MQQQLTLYELNSLVRETLELAMPQEYWVEAELAELRERGGHCYMELVQTSATKQLLAKASARCWRNTWQLVRLHFEQMTGRQLHAGMTVLLKVYPQFHEAYGFSWIVSDINPEFTMGDMARKRQEIIRQLQEEGVFDLQKELSLPLFAQHIAVISSESAAGYGDFCNQLADNNFAFQFHTELFPAIMQGEQVEATIIQALNRIHERIDDFDVVVIIRGGGATTDLSGFDTLSLAENVANFPLPIITGIGHDRDETILDMISHVRVKTPTAAADLLIGHLTQVNDRIEAARNTMARYVGQRMEREHMRLEKLSSGIPVLFSLVKNRQFARIERLSARLASGMQEKVRDERYHLQLIQNSLPAILDRRIIREKHRLAQWELRLQAADPQVQMKRGFSITIHNGKIVRDAAQLKPGDKVLTHLQQGKIETIVETIEN